MRVVLADVEGMARSALTTLLREIDGVTVVEVGTRPELARALRRQRADLLIIDDRLVEDGNHVLAGLGPGNGAARVIVIGVDDDPAYAARARRIGAEAWVAKDRADEDLLSLLVPG
jgi:DNA-binding NarL/FixJ family response regulator